MKAAAKPPKTTVPTIHSKFKDAEATPPRTPRIANTTANKKMLIRKM